MYDSRYIANRFIELAKARGETLTPMQLIKLVYIAHGWMLGLYHRALIKDEVQAWQYGPVIPRLYNSVRAYRGQPVADAISSDNHDLSPEADRLVQQVYDRYGKLSGPALSRLTHASGTPWERTYEPGSFGLVIPDDLIEDHFARLRSKAG